MVNFLWIFAIASVTALVGATMLAGFIGKYNFPLPPNDRRIGCIDGLRGYLALSVMIHHFFIWTRMTRMGGSWEPPPVYFLNQLGAGGVAFFFMVTGLVFYPRILTGYRSTNWLAVYTTRAFRILPLVVCSVGIVTLIIMLRTGSVLDARFLADAAKWVSSWAEVDLLDYEDSGRINSYVLWSLWYEWLFYLFVLPLCAAGMDFVRNRSLPSWVVPLTLLGASVFARLVLSKLSVDIDGLRYLPLFAIGMLAYEIQTRTVFCEILSKPIISMLAVGALLIAMITTQFPYNMSLPLFGFFFVCVACGNDFGGVLRTQGALVLGECSFGIYLLHGIVLDTMFVDAHLTLARLTTIALPVLLPIVAIFIILATSLTYLVVERPAMHQGKLLASWLVGRRIKLSEREMETAP